MRVSVTLLLGDTSTIVLFGHLDPPSTLVLYEDGFSPFDRSWLCIKTEVAT
jgi:hypothetical protein